MSQKVANGDFRLGEFRKVCLDGGVQVDFAAFVQKHDCGGGGDDFGEGSGIEDCVFGHGFGGFDAALTVGAMIFDAAVFDPKNAAGEAVGRDVGGDGGVDLGEFLCMKRVSRKERS